MGDLSTHKAIYSEIVSPILARSLGLNLADISCFEMGNWLRDVSQFRDPYALQLKKISLFYEILNSKLKQSAGRIAIRPVLNEIFGPSHYDKDPAIISGAFGEWFKQILFAFGIENFRTPPTANQALVKETLISDERFRKIYEQNFTQYFPHEHLDFPPTGDPKNLGDWSTQSYMSQEKGGPTRKMAAYLDEYIEYIAAQLTWVERDLKKLLKSRPNITTTETGITKWHESIQDCLIKWGRASHAIEDYYFHSNFTEIGFLTASTVNNAEIVGLHDFFNIPGIGKLNEGEKRKLFRRSRTPVAENDSNRKAILSKSKSANTNLMFTGMFGDEDVLFTFADAFDSMMSNESIRILIEKLESTLFKYLFIPEFRRKLVKQEGDKVVTNEQVLANVIALHIDELERGTINQKAEKVNKYSPMFVAAFKQANMIDLTLYKLLQKKEMNLSIGYILLTLTSKVEAASQNSERIQAKMNSQPQDSFYIASDNTNGSENIGTHSLMSKDSIRKNPLRKQADEFAKLAVKMVTETMVKSLIISANANKFIDWKDYLRRWICHPRQAPGNWVVLRWKGNTIPELLKQPLWISASESDSVIRAGLNLTIKLEKFYKDLYENARKDWERLTAE